MSALGFAALWLNPALLLGVAAQLYAGGSAGLAPALLLVLVPCSALLGPRSDRESEPTLFSVVLMVLAAILLLTANLLVIGDVAANAGAPRWHGVVVAAGCAFALTIVPLADRMWPWLAPGALAQVVLVVGTVAVVAGVGPMGAWTRAASRPDIRFAATSPWVARGGEFQSPGSLLFTEVQTVRALSADVFRVVVADPPGPVVHEWRPVPGDAITLRPGDRLSYEAGARLQFSEGSRVPGAPASGPGWAAAASRPATARRLVDLLGLWVTLALGGAALLRPGAPATRAGASAALALVLTALWSIAGWAVYAAWLAPDLLLGDGRAGALIQFPIYALDGPWGRRLTGILTAGLIALFVATASALRSRIGALDRAGGELGRDVILWAAMFGVAAVVSLWPSDPWTIFLLALGLLASTLGPAALIRRLADPRARTLASAVGLALVVALLLAAPASGGTGLEPLTRYPALIAAPACWVALRLVRRRPA
jgi:hypothetical protein